MNTSANQTPSSSRKAVRYVLFFDGTRNDGRSNTNIYRLYQRLACEGTDVVRQEPIRQEAWYRKGVGIKPWEQIRGGAFGMHLSKHIKLGYEWLSEHHREGDQICIFGFSRGAFTAMGLVGLLAWRGLPKESISRREVKKVFHRYRQATQKSREDQSPGARPLDALRALSVEEQQRLDAQDKRLLDMFRLVSIGFVGLFDTVRAAGLEVLRYPGRARVREVAQEEIQTATSQAGTLALRYTRHLPANVEAAYHALAVDEHRAVFHPRVWIVPKRPEWPRDRAQPKQTAEQRWFIGSHANVGGGYLADQLANIPLHWMQQNAKKMGIGFTEDVTEPVPPPGYWGLPRFQRKDSYSEWLGHIYRHIRTRYYRPIYAWGLRHEDPVIEYERVTIDDSVLHRILQDKDYRPRNVKTCLEQLRGAKIALDPLTDRLVEECLRTPGWLNGD